MKRLSGRAFRRTTPALLITITATASFSPLTHADPTLSVRDGGTANGNRRWIVEVSPDPSLFSQTTEGWGGSMVAEIDFTLENSQFVSIMTNPVDWMDGPGFNPFTGGISSGVTHDATTAFVAQLGNVFFSGDPVEVAVLETEGTAPATLRWGGNTVLAGTPFEFTSARLAQAGLNFDDNTGSLTLGFVPLEADFDKDGDVDGEDFLIWQTGFLVFNGDATANDGDANGDGDVDGQDFLVWQETFGTGLVSPVVRYRVPEPSMAMLLLLAGTAALAGPRLQGRHEHGQTGCGRSRFRRPRHCGRGGSTARRALRDARRHRPA